MSRGGLFILNVVLHMILFSAKPLHDWRPETPTMLQCSNQDSDSQSAGKVMMGVIFQEVEVAIMEVCISHCAKR